MPIRFTLMDALAGSRACIVLDRGWVEVSWASFVAKSPEPFEALPPAIPSSRFLEKRDLNRLILLQMQHRYTGDFA